MNPNQLADEADRLAQRANELAVHAHALLEGTTGVVTEVAPGSCTVTGTSGSPAAPVLTVNIGVVCT